MFENVSDQGRAEGGYGNESWSREASFLTAITTGGRGERCGRRSRRVVEGGVVGGNRNGSRVALWAAIATGQGRRR